MLFARGVWSIFGIRKSSLDAFRASLADKTKLVAASQLVASVRTKFGGAPSYGMNPYEGPRKDEGLTNQNDLKQLAEQIEKGNVNAPFWSEYYGSEDIQFALGDDQFGFWFVINDSEDVSDPKSKQEALAYKDASKPFKFLTKDEKKVIEANVVVSAVPARKQFPVLIDFHSELVFVASGSVDEVGLVRTLIATLGGEDYSLAWQFDSFDWPARFLSAVSEKNRFAGEMAARAEELSRFRPEEVEKLDDKMMEGIVSTYFAMSQLDTGLWAGLTTPARIRLYRPSDPVGASNPSVAFSILREFNGAQIAAASVVFQSLESRFTKKGDERQVRSDLFTIDVNDNVNLTDAGAAMLRGFDIPTFKREMKKAMKNRGGSLRIGEFWKEWLSSMKTSVNTFVDNVTDTLQIDKQKFGLKPYEGETETEQ